MKKYMYVLYIRTLSDEIKYYYERDMFNPSQYINEATKYSSQREAEKAASFIDIKYKIGRVESLGNVGFEMYKLI